MAKRVLKHWRPEAQAYIVQPQPSAHDQAAAVALLQQAHETAAAIIEQAQQEAAAIRAAAEQERQAAWDALLAQARALASQEAAQQLTAEIEQTIGRFRTIVERACLREDELRRACQHELVHLALAIAEAVIRREIRHDPTILQRLVEAAVARAPRVPLTQLFVHPSDVAAITPWIREIWGEQPPIEIIPDAHVDPGSCVLGTQTGFVDARIRTQLETIRQALLEEVDSDDAAS
ncbi:MAG: type III secretion system protein [Thermorudis peleae]|nr:type III secretion system protein [Thermorudis peleae]